jgi:hypothetical protein
MISKLSMAIKVSTFLIVIIISILHLPCFASESFTNAKLVNYNFGRYHFNYFLIIPDNLSEYEYLSHNPFTAFMFLEYYDKDKIAELTVKELKSRSLGGPDSCCVDDGFFDALNLDKIKGFEDIAEALADYNEFDIAEKKDQILSKLVDIYGKYKEEHNRYLQGFEGTYTFRKANLKHSTLKKLKEYNETIEIIEPNPMSFYERIDIKNYDFDQKLFNIDVLRPKSKRSSQGWEYHYVKDFKKKYGKLEYQKKPFLYNIDFPENIKIPMTLKDAKKIFPEDDRVLCETILTVTPEEGSFGYPGASFFVMTSRFSIKKVTKNYYKRKDWSNKEQKFIEDPVFTIELKSKENRPFY